MRLPKIRSMKYSVFSCAASMVLDDRGQFGEEEDDDDGEVEGGGAGLIFDTMLIENITNQVTIL